MIGWLRKNDPSARGRSAACLNEGGEPPLGREQPPDSYPSTPVEEIYLRLGIDRPALLEGWARDLADDKLFAAAETVLDEVARFCHLLPLNAGGYQGEGGLLKLAVRTATFALRSTHSFVWVPYTDPDRRDLEPRWRFALFLGGIIWWLGVPSATMRVSSQDGRIWKPALQGLSDWLDRNGSDYYRVGVLNSEPLVATRPVGADCLGWLAGRYLGDEIAEIIDGPGGQPFGTIMRTWAGREGGRYTEVLVRSASHALNAESIGGAGVRPASHSGIPLGAMLIGSIRAAAGSGEGWVRLSPDNLTAWLTWPEAAYELSSSLPPSFSGAQGSVPHYIASLLVDAKIVRNGNTANIPGTSELQGLRLYSVATAWPDRPPVEEPTPAPLDKTPAQAPLATAPAGPAPNQEGEPTPPEAQLELAVPEHQVESVRGVERWGRELLKVLAKPDQSVFPQSQGAVWVPRAFLREITDGEDGQLRDWLSEQGYVVEELVEGARYKPMEVGGRAQPCVPVVHISQGAASQAPEGED